MNRHTHTRGMTLVELIVVVAIIAIAAAVVAPEFIVMIRKNALDNQMRFVKATLLKVKSNAIENTAAVRFSIDPTTGKMLALRDANRDGDFEDDPELVLGSQRADNTFEGIDSPYVDSVDFIDGTGVDLPFWFQGDSFEGSKAMPFEDHTLIALPNGQIYNSDLQPASGTFFFQTEDGDLKGAVHITAMGEIKMATNFVKVGDEYDWGWKHK